MQIVWNVWIHGKAQPIETDKKSRCTCSPLLCGLKSKKMLYPSDGDMEDTDNE